MAESTLGNEVYLDKDGKVVGKGDTRALTVISRREAEERGLMPKTDASAPQPSDRITFSDGSSVQHLSGTNLTTPTPVPAVAETPEAEEETEEEDEEADTDKKAIKSAPEDKAVHKTAKK